LFACQSICMQKFENSWKNFHEIWFWEYSIQFDNTLKICLRWDKNYRRFQKELRVFLPEKLTEWVLPSLEILTWESPEAEFNAIHKRKRSNYSKLTKTVTPCEHFASWYYWFSFITSWRINRQWLNGSLPTI
jgi:hypothetical protein